MLRLNFMKCNETRLPKGKKCASSEELAMFFQLNEFILMAARSFVNFVEVKPGENQVQQLLQIVDHG
jgi:hypothetical protein